MAYDDISNRGTGKKYDPALLADGILPAPAQIIHCNVSDTYRLWTTNSNYSDEYLAKGLPYPEFTNVIRITTTANAVVDAGDLSVTI